MPKFLVCGTKIDDMSPETKSESFPYRGRIENRNSTSFDHAFCKVSQNHKVINDMNTVVV